MILILVFHYEECWMKWDLHVTGEPGEASVCRRGGCTINCNLHNHVPSSVVTKSRDGRSSASRRRIAAEEADNDTDEILEKRREAAQGHIQEELDTSNRKGWSRMRPRRTKGQEIPEKNTKTLEWADPVEMSMISLPFYLQTPNFKIDRCDRNIRNEMCKYHPSCSHSVACRKFGRCDSVSSQSPQYRN